MIGMGETATSANQLASTLNGSRAVLIGARASAV